MAMSAPATVLAVFLTSPLLAALAVAGPPEAASEPHLQAPLTALPDASPEHTGVEAPPGSELWAEARLMTTYSLNEHLNPFDIDVDVEGDTVILSGVLGSPVERDLAVRLARDLSGIDKVDDRLQVASPGASVPLADSVFRMVDAANTTARVKLQLLWREPVDGLLVDVTTSGDKVILSGAVRTEEARQLAERIARRTTGVAEVENHLAVDPGARIPDDAGALMTAAAETASDAWLTARVAASLRFDRTVDAERVEISAQDGVVSLSGEVPTAAQKREAAAVAVAIDGVKRVENLLGIEARGR
jgi:osmotically-inducible protein OsmY